MSSVLSNLSGSIGGVIGGTEHWIDKEWTQRVVQVSVYAAIVFFVLSSYPLIAFVEKHVWNIFGVKLGKEGTLALHSVIFGLFMYIGTRFILDPMVKRVVEGSGHGDDGDNNEPYGHGDRHTTNHVFDVGEKCVIDTDCAKGLQCDDKTNRCTSKCQYGDLCPQGFTCDDGYCVHED